MKRVCVFLSLLCILIALGLPTAASAQSIPNWQPNTSYAIGALVMYNGVEYQCIQAPHVPSGVGASERSRSLEAGQRWRRQLHVRTQRSDWIVGVCDEQLRHNLELERGNSSFQLQYQQLHRIAERDLYWKHIQYILFRVWAFGFDHLQLHCRGE